MTEPALPPETPPTATPAHKRGPWILAGLFVLATGLAIALWRFDSEKQWLPVNASDTTQALAEAPMPALPPIPNVEAPADEGPVFRLGAIAVIDEPDPESPRKLKLRVPIELTGETKIVMRELVIEVCFYDRIATGAVLPTKASVRSTWSTPPTDWSDGGVEVLEVDYTLAKPATPAEIAEARQFYGYLVRLYYQNRLQQVEAQPPDLNERFPTPAVRTPDPVP
jgi:hypothetical protein